MDPNPHPMTRKATRKAAVSSCKKNNNNSVKQFQTKLIHELALI
jgi:hypothetical protein